MGSRIHREVYVRFRGEDSETCCCEAVRRRILSLQLVGREQLAAQGVSGRQVHKGATGAEKLQFSLWRLGAD